MSKSAKFKKDALRKLVELKDSVRKWVLWAYDHSNGIKSVAGGLLIAASYLVKLKNPALGDALRKAGEQILIIGAYDKARKFARGKPQTTAPLAMNILNKIPFRKFPKQ